MMMKVYSPDPCASTTKQNDGKDAYVLIKTLLPYSGIRMCIITLCFVSLSFFTGCWDSISLDKPKASDSICFSGVNVTNEYGYTLFHLAALQGNTNVLREILNTQTFDIDLANPFSGETALTYAAARGNDQVVNFLLKEGANPNLRDLGDHTALNKAVADGFASTVDLLLRNGAKAEVCDKYGFTPLFLALMDPDGDRKERLQKVIHLVESGSNPLAKYINLCAIPDSCVFGNRIKIDTPNDGETALDFANRLGFDNEVKIMQEKLAKTDTGSIIPERESRGN